jgi:hypothetical protein
VERVRSAAGRHVDDRPLVAPVFRAVETGEHLEFTQELNARRAITVGAAPR